MRSLDPIRSSQLRLIWIAIARASPGGAQIISLCHRKIDQTSQPGPEKVGVATCCAPRLVRFLMGSACFRSASSAPSVVKYSTVPGGTGGISSRLACSMQDRRGARRMHHHITHAGGQDAGAGQPTSVLREGVFSPHLPILHHHAYMLVVTMMYLWNMQDKTRHGSTSSSAALLSAMLT